MRNKELIDLGIKLLKEADLKEVEIAQVEHTKYDDGSTCLEVRVSFLNEKEMDKQ